VALLARERGSGGVGADIDAAGIQNVGDHRGADIAEHDAGENLHAIGLQIAFRGRLGLTGLAAVVLDHHLRLRHAGLFQREMESVADIRPEIASRAG
jgi:hypothetical protein